MVRAKSVNRQWATHFHPPSLRFGGQIIFKFSNLHISTLAH